MTNLTLVTVSARSFFKKVSEKSGKANAGQKRPDLAWTFGGVSAQTVSQIPAEKLATVVNNFIENFGRKLIAQNGEDWSFCPSPEVCNFDAAFDDLVAERTSGRILTKESLAAFGAVYSELAQYKLGVPAQSALLGEKLICEKFQRIAGKDDVLEVMERRISAIIELEDEYSLSLLEPHAAVIEALFQLLSELKSVTVTADAL